MTRLTLLCSTLLLIALVGLDAQDLETSQASYADEIPAETRNEIVRIVNSALRKYKNYGTLLDRDLGKVSLHSEDIFLELFTQNATVISDLARNSDMISIQSYLAPVPEAHPKGLRFDLENLSLEDVSIDASGNFRVVIKVEKHIYQGIETDGSGFSCELGRRYRMQMDYRVPSAKLDRAFIHRIEGDLVYDGCIRQELSQPKLQIFAGADLDIEGVTLMPNSVRNAASSSSLNFGIHGRYFLKDGLGVHAGIFYGSRDLDLRLNEAAFNLGGPGIDGDGDAYIQSANLNSSRDRTSFTQLEIPVGVTISTYSGGKSYGLEISAVPTMISIDPIQSQSLAQFDVTYEDLQLHLSGSEVSQLVEDPSLLAGLPFGIVDGGAQTIDVDDRLTTSLVKVRFAPYMTLQINKNISLELSIYYKLAISDLYEGSPTITDELTRESFEDFSIIRDVVERIGINSYGARLGVTFGL